MKQRRQWKECFVRAFRVMGNVTHAATAAGVSRDTVYKAREIDPEFAKAWDDAQEQAADRVEAEIFRRAVTGVEKAVWHQGEQCGVEVVYSDGLLTLLAKALRPHKFRDRHEVAIGNPDGTNLQLESRQQALNLFAGSPEAAAHMIALANLMVPQEALPPGERGPTQPTRGVPESSPAPDPNPVTHDDHSGGSRGRMPDPGPDNSVDVPKTAKAGQPRGSKPRVRPKTPKAPENPPEADWRGFIKDGEDAQE